MSSGSYSQTIEAVPGQSIQSEASASENSPIAYGLGTFGLEATFKAFWGFYLFFYVDVLGLAVALAAIINVIYALWDALNDPLVGYLSDNTRTRWGRRRPWLLAGLPFYLIFLVLIYAVPETVRQGASLFWYALGMIFLFETASTIINTNYEALFPELFQGFRERTRASAYTQGFGMGGELAGFVLTPIIYSQYGFVPMALFFATIAGILLIYSLKRNSEDPSAQEVAPLDLKGAFGDVLQDRPFWQFTIVATLLWFTTGVYTLATPFYAKYTLKASPQAPSLIFGTVFVVAILVVSLWSRLIRRWGIKHTWLWAIGVMITSAIVLGLAPNMVVALIGAGLAGVGLGGVKVCREMILAGLVFGADSLGFLPQVGKANAWSWVFSGVGLYGTLMNLYYAASPDKINPRTWDYLWSGFWLILGLSGFFAVNIFWPVALLLIGGAILIRGLTRKD